jgi:type II secretion system protein N
MLRKTLFSAIFAFLLANLFVLSFWLGLSSQVLTQWFTYQLNRSVSNKFVLELKSAKSNFHGLILEELVLNTNKKKLTVFQIQSIKFNLSPVSLLLFQKIPYKINVYNGNIYGDIKLFPSLQANFYAKDIQLNRNKQIRKSNILLSNPLLQIEGKCELTPEIRAHLKFNLKDLSLSGNMKDTGLPFALPLTNINSLDAILTYEKNQLKIDAKSKGNITGNIAGIVQVNQTNIRRSRLDLKMTSRLDRDYQNNMGVLIELLNNYKNRTGQISIRIKGTAQYPIVEKI